MRKLIAQSHVIRQNWLAIMAFCLLCYFSYHALLGERSTVRLMSLERQIAKVSETYDGLHDERTILEAKVVRLRPGSLDKDMLEERVRIVLGFYRPDETVILR